MRKLPIEHKTATDMQIDICHGEYVTVIALGSNLGERASYIESALSHISQKFGKILSTSQIYETAPMGGAANKLFLNCCSLVQTALTPIDQINILLNIETLLGRTRKVRWDNRTIDLDIVTIERKKESRGQTTDPGILNLGDFHPITLSEASLTCPHPRLEERNFVLVPTVDVHPYGMHLPTGIRFKDLLKLKNYGLSPKI